MKFPQVQPISLKLAGCIHNVDLKYWWKFELNPIIRPDIRIGYFRMYVSPDDKTFFTYYIHYGSRYWPYYKQTISDVIIRISGRISGRIKFPQIQPICLKLAGCMYNVDLKYWWKFELNPIIRPDIRIGYFRMYVSPDDKTFFTYYIHYGSRYWPYYKQTISDVILRVCVRFLCL